ncbi:MAG TPA: TspO/MBR family protein [Polyangiaceae bacterium]|nr:TspO/MBR family protein [Polyangiaceae bacterium]
METSLDTNPRTAMSDVAAMAAFGGATAATAALGTLAMGDGPRSAWYMALRKPAFQPPASVFAPVWTALYSSIAYSGYRTFRAPPSRTRTAALALWGAQLVLNGLWTPLFFGQKRARASLVDSTLLLGTAAGYAQTASKVDKRAAWTFAPYVGWLAFATLLNADIVRKNRRRFWF